MKMILRFLPFLLVLFALPSLAQTPRPTPTPRVVKGEDVVVISTELIQIDVTVTDKNGKIVSDLTADDFEIFENDEKQAISNFSFIDVQSPLPSVKNKVEKKPKNGLPDPVSAVHLRPDQVRRTIALVVDDLGLSFSSIFFIQKSLKKFVDEQMQPGDLVAIIRTGGGIGVLQQFTADKNLLYASIERIRFNSNSRVGVSSFAGR